MPAEGALVHEHVVVVAGGGPVPPAPLPEGAPVVAADGGVDAALALGLHVDLVVGDLDSATPAGLAEAERGGARIERHPVDKDATDLALALDAAAHLGERLVVLGTGGGRFDHLLAGVLTLAAEGRPPVHAHVGDATVQVVHGPGAVDVAAAVGDLVSLIPVSGDAVGVRTTGLRFPLRAEALPFGTTRGVSNVVDEAPASVALDRGCLLVVCPGEER
jgi:thiamine pyrophosphokinase